MDEFKKIFRVQAGDEDLSIPFVVNVRDMKPDDLDTMLDLMENKLGANYFREKDLFMEVLEDKVASQKDTQKWLYGPYVGVVITNKGEVRLSAFDEVEGGMTVYAADSFNRLARAVEEPIEVPAPARRSGMRPG